MLFIKIGTVFKDEDHLKEFRTRKNTYPTVRKIFQNGQPEFEVDFSHIGYQSIKSVSFTIKTKQVDGGYEVLKVYKFED